MRHPLRAVALFALASLAPSSPAGDRAEEAEAKRVRAAVARGVAYLKREQRPDGTWESGILGTTHPAGVTSLVLLALLEAGVSTDDRAVTQALAFLEKQRPDHTYVLSLQTLVFCKVGARKYPDLIRRNAERLLVGRRRDARNRFLGWTYRCRDPQGGNRTDFSNTEYAVRALDAARRAGARIETEVWSEVRELYLRSQEEDGGWPYPILQPGPFSRDSTKSMTHAGLSVLLLTDGRLNDTPDDVRAAEARAFERLGREFSGTGEFHFFCLDPIALTRRLALEGRVKAAHEEQAEQWYRDATRELLRKQKEAGSWEPGGTFQKHPLVATSLAVLFLAEQARGGAEELPLLVRDDFEKGAGRWEPTDPEAWKVVRTERGKAYSQFRQSAYKPPHRSPHNIALLKEVVVGDFVLEADVQSTGKDGPHRDMCLFFGYQDPAHFYYVHIAKRADDHANQIFIVNGAPRKKISMKSTPGTPWDDRWHRVKIVRTVADGSIAVYFDDLKRPIMTARDTTFTWGRVGLGSFDDSGNWANFRLRGVRVEKK
jgi:hypothetical protein